MRKTYNPDRQYSQKTPMTTAGQYQIDNHTLHPRITIKPDIVLILNSIITTLRWSSVVYGDSNIPHHRTLTK